MNDFADVHVIQAYAAAPSSAGSKLNFPAINCQVNYSSVTCLVGPHRFQLRAYLQMLAGISNPVQGRVEVFDQVISELDQVKWQKIRSRIGYLSGTSPLLSVQHGLMNVMLPVLYHNNLSFKDAADKARLLLNELHCHFEFTKFPAQLNSFQILQLALARALILDPSLLFLDVPFHDLGAKQREKMGTLLAEHKKERALCMIGGLQYIHFLEEHASQIIFISDHKAIVFNSWKAFLQTEEPEVKDLLSLSQRSN